MRTILLSLLILALCLGFAACNTNVLVTTLDLLADACVTAAPFCPPPFNAYVAAAGEFCSFVAGKLAGGDPTLAADTVAEAAKLTVPNLTNASPRTVALVQAIAGLVQRVIQQVGPVPVATPKFTAPRPVPSKTVADCQRIQAKAVAAVRVAQAQK